MAYKKPLLLFCLLFTILLSIGLVSAFNTDDMVLFVPFNESSGTIANDYGGSINNSFDLKSSSTASFITDVDGFTRANFTGSCSSPNCPETINYTELDYLAGSDFSSCVVLNIPDAVTRGEDKYIFRSYGSRETRWGIESDDQIAFQYMNSALSTSFNITDYIGSPFHLCVSYDNANNVAYHYVNSTLLGNTTNNQDGDMTPLILFNVGHRNNVNDFIGTMGNFRYWTNYSLSTNEIVEVFNNDLNISEEETPLVIDDFVAVNITMNDFDNFGKDYSDYNHTVDLIGNASYTNSSVCKYYGCLNVSTNGGDWLQINVSQFNISDGIAWSWWDYRIADTNPQGTFAYDFDQDVKRIYSNYGSYCAEINIETINSSNSSDGTRVGMLSEGCTSLNAWNHNFIQYNPVTGTMQYFFNGVLVKESTGGEDSVSFNANESVAFGRSIYGIDFEGYMDELLVYTIGNFSEDYVSDLYDSTRQGTPPDVDIFVESIKYELSVNWSNRHNNLTLTEMPINFTVKNEGVLGSTGFFNVSFVLNDTVLQTWRVNLSAEESVLLQYNWTPSYKAYYSGWLNIDTENEVTEDSEVNNVQRVYIPFLDRPFFLFTRDEWITKIEPFASNSSNIVAYDSYEWTKGFISEAWNEAWTGNDVDPRAKKGRENANNCFINDYPNSTACDRAKDYLLGWANRTTSTYSNAQAIHELIHVGVTYDLMFSNLTEEENDLVVEGFHDICQYVTNIVGIRPDLDEEGLISGDNGFGFGSGVGGFCYMIVGSYSENPTMIHENPSSYWGKNLQDEWMDREISYIKAYKNDSYAKYQEGWLYKFYSQSHIVENFLFELRYSLNNISIYQNALNAMGLELLTDYLDASYNGDDLRNDENRYSRGIQRGDANSYEAVGGDSTVSYGIASYYGFLTNDSNVASGLLYFRNLVHTADTISQNNEVDWYMYQKMYASASGVSSTNGLKNFYFDNANDIVTFRDGYTYSNDTVILIDGGEERGGGHSQAQGFYLYALGEPFLDYEQVPLNDDVRLATWKNAVTLSNYTTALYSATCGTIGGDYSYLGSSSCTTVGSYPDFRESSIEYFGNIEDYMGAFSGSLGGAYKYTPMASTTEPVKEYFVKFGDFMARHIVVVNSASGEILDNNLQLDEEFNFFKSGNDVRYTRIGTDKNLRMNTIYSNATADLQIYDTGVTASNTKTGSATLNVSYQRAVLHISEPSASFIRSYNWYEGIAVNNASLVDTTDKGVVYGDNVVIFDTDVDGVINHTNITGDGWALAYNTTTIAGFNTTTIDYNNNDVLRSDLPLSVAISRSASSYTVHVNTNVPNTYNDQPRTVNLTVDISELTNNTDLIVTKNGVPVTDVEGTNEVSFLAISNDALGSDYLIVGFNASECTVNITSTALTDWTNITCLPSNLMNQSRSVLYYDDNDCGVYTNTTTTEYRATEACVYSTPSTPIVVTGNSHILALKNPFLLAVGLLGLIVIAFIVPDIIKPLGLKSVNNLNLNDRLTMIFIVLLIIIVVTGIAFFLINTLAAV